MILNNSSEDAAGRLNASIWKVDEDINAPVLATYVVLDFIISLPIVTFILVHSLYNAKETLRNSSSLFFFNLTLINFLIVVFYIPFTIIALIAGEWIFGDSDEVRSGFCYLQGTLFAFSVSITFDILAFISFDRFLCIVKSEFYQKYWTWKVAHIAASVVWVLFDCVVVS